MEVAESVVPANTVYKYWSVFLLQEELLKELDEIHSANELSIMDMFHSIEKTVERMEDSCRFTERILEHGNGVEVLSLKKHVSIQLLMLLNNIPRPEPSVKIEFHTDTDKFGTMMKMAFGRFKRPDELNRVSFIVVTCSSIIANMTRIFLVFVVKALSPAL